MAGRFGVSELAELGSYGRLARATRAVPLWPKESFYFAQYDAPGHEAPGQAVPHDVEHAERTAGTFELGGDAVEGTRVARAEASDVDDLGGHGS